MRFGQVAAALGGALLSACSAPVPGALSPGAQQTLRVENDSLGLQDGNYTSGIAATFISPAHSRAAAPGPVARLGERALTLFGASPSKERRSGLTVSHLIFTPENLTAKNPPPRAHPYSGSLLADASLFATGPDSLTAVTLRLGVVGPITQTESIQKAFHRNFGATRPRGWSHQVPTEPIVNLSAEQFRILERGRLGPLSVDWTGDIGLGAGTYFTGARLGTTLRFGSLLPRDFGRADVRTGFIATPILEPASTRPDATFAYLDLVGYAVARSLPVDGAFFSKSRSTDRRAGVLSGTLGTAISRGRTQLTFSYTLLSDTYEAQGQLGEYGAIALTILR